MVNNGTIIVCGSPDAVGLAYAILNFKTRLISEPYSSNENYYYQSGY